MTLNFKPKTLFKNLAEAVRLMDVEKVEDAVNAVIDAYGVSLAADPEDLREMYTGGAMTGHSRSTVADTFADLLQNEEGFNAERFLRHANDQGKKHAQDSQPGFTYPTTARRAFVNLSDAIRQLGSEDETRGMLLALANLHVHDVTKSNLALLYLEHQGSDRIDMARAMARLLDGHEKFDTARFIHHATSDSTADNDGESGKWSYNRTHQAEAQKTTIEAVSDDGESSETVIL